jgi:two-component system chemotaxis response regulator CheY
MKMSIVIVDDSKTARFLIRQYVEMAGFDEAEFIEAANGREALAVVTDKAPGLVISDFKMPEMDGLELLCRIKENPAFRDLPVVMITSFANQAKIEELRASGAFAVLQKPVTPELLHKVLRPLLPV